MLERNLSEERSKMTKETLSVMAFAKLLGAAARKTSEASLPFHEAYVAATAQQRAQLKKDWMIGHLDGQGVENPERTLSKGKAKGTKMAVKHAIDKAYSDFSYHIIRRAKKVAKIGSSDLVAAAMRLVKKMTTVQKRKLTRLMAE